MLKPLTYSYMSMVETYLRFVISQLLRLYFQFSAFFLILTYFPHSNCNIEACIGRIVLQTCVCHDTVFEVNVLRLCFGIFTFVATKMPSQKALFYLTEIRDAFSTG